MIKVRNTRIPGYRAESSLVDGHAHYIRRFESCSDVVRLAENCSGGGATCQCDDKCYSHSGGCFCKKKVETQPVNH